jgi:hypothetical protein
VSEQASGADPVPWRKGRWIDAAEALLELRAHHSSTEFRALIQTTLGTEWAGNSEVARRFERIGSLATYADEDPSGDLVRAEARRGDLLGASVIQLANGLGMTRLALSATASRQHPLTEAELAEARAVTSEDLRFVFDFEAMSRCTEAIAIFLIDLARHQHRFDDFMIALRMVNLHMSLPEPQRGKSTELGQTMLDFILHEPCISARERQERLRMIPALRTWFGPQLEAGSLPDAFATLFEEADLIDPDSLSIDTRPRDQKAEFARLARGCLSSGDTDALSDLLFLCGIPSPGETPQQKAGRLDRLSETLHLRGTLTDSPAELVQAAKSEIEAIELLDPSDPLRQPYIANLARCQLGFLITSADEVSPHAKGLRKRLPPLPEMPELVGTVEIGIAYSTLAVLELTVALESPRDSRESWREAVAAGDAAIRHFTPEEPRHHFDEVAAVRASALVLGAARESRDIEEKDLALLVAAIQTPFRASRARKLALGVAGEAIESHPAARAPLRRSLQGLSKPPFEITLLRARLALAEGDLGGPLDACDEAVRQIGNLIAGAGASEELEALQLRGDAVGQLLAAERPAAAAVILEAVPGGPPTRSIMSGSERCQNTRLHLLVDGREVTVLVSPPNQDWTVISRRSMDELERLMPSRWLKENPAPTALAWRQWMTELAGPLAALLADNLAHQEKAATGPVLCTTMPFPISLVNWVRPELGLAYAQVIGPLTDSVGAMIATPLPDEARVTVLAGPDGAEGDETVADTAAICAAGFEPDLIASTTEPDLLASLRESHVVHISGYLLRHGDDIVLAAGNGSGMVAGNLHGLYLDQARVVTFLSPTGELPADWMAMEVTRTAHGLIAAGAGAVVTSVGPTFAAPNKLFLNAFYPALGRRVSIADAFAAGIEAVRSHKVNGAAPYEHPAYWAGITLFTGTSISRGKESQERG